MDVYKTNTDSPTDTETRGLCPDLSELNLDDDKHNVDSSIDQLDSDTHADKWNSPTYSSNEGNNSRDKELKFNNSDKELTLNNSDNPAANKGDPLKQDKRRNNRLQSGAGGDKYKNAHRFSGGHNKANSEREKPKVNTPTDTDIRTTPGAGDDKDSQERGHGRDSANGQNFSHPPVVSRETDEFVFFWREGSPFSQWHPAKFIVDDVTFNCAEQYMMYQKAKAFGNDAIADMIMQENNPYSMKQFGRQIPEFDPAVWRTICKKVVKKGTIEKFSQNKELQDQLIATYPKTLVEASPSDHVWGIGLSAYSPDAINVEKWKGENLLGKILTEVRDELLKEIGFLE